MDHSLFRPGNHTHLPICRASALVRHKPIRTRIRGVGLALGKYWR
jgi:hypothetical protein